VTAEEQSQLAVSATMPGRAVRSDDGYAHLFRDLTFEPVFIIGDHRSGTTVLYQLLASTGAFNILTAYDIIGYDELVAHHVAGTSDQARQALAARFATLGLDNRGIDGVRVEPDSPEEYGYIIENSARPQLHPGTYPRFVEVCQKLRLIGGDRPLLLKSPWDVLTFAYVKAAVPNSKFIFLHRHPLHVMQSQLAAVRSLMASRNEYVAMLSSWYRGLFSSPLALGLARAANSQRFGVGARVVGRHVTKVANYYLAHIDEIPAADYTELRYEDLCAAPEETLQRLLTFLGRRVEIPAGVRQFINPRNPRVLPEVSARYRQIRGQLEPFCQRRNYPVDVSA